MVKGTKRKATMEKITKRESAATTFTKRTYGLHSKIAQLCLLTDAQIAVLATPPSANSNVSFYSFGHSSVDSIVNAFLTGEKPVRQERDDYDKEDLGICFARKELGLPLWWEDDALLKSKNPQELTRAINSMSRLLSKINDLRGDDAEAEAEPPLKKQKKNTEPTVEQTLVFQSGSSSSNNTTEEDDKTLDYKNNVVTEEELDQIMSTCDDTYCLPHNNNNDSSEIDIDQLIDFDQLIDPHFDFDFESTSSFDNNNEALKLTEPLDQPLSPPSDICGGAPDNNNNNNFSTGEMSLDYGIDIHQLDDFDFDTSSVFVDKSLLDSINSSMNCVASGDGFVESTTTQETTVTEETNTYALNIVASDDASALNEDDISFSDYLSQFLQS